jgi:hypothetical protein
MNQYSVPLVALGLLAGCATAPPPPRRADNPANPAAPEAAVRPLRNTLGVDGLTQKSRQILAQAAKEQQHWDQSGDRQGEQMQNMPGMQMPQPPEPPPTPPREQSQPSLTPNN